MLERSDPSRAFDHLSMKSGFSIEQTLKDIDLTLPQAKQILRLAALLHDTGHLPFSHAGEIVLPKDKNTNT